MFVAASSSRASPPPPLRLGKTAFAFVLPLFFSHEADFSSNSVSLAATWDHQVIRDLAEILIAEVKSKEVDVLLGPTSRFQHQQTFQIEPD